MMADRLETLKKFLAEDPADPFNHYTVALEYVSMQQYAQAITAFEEILKIDPKYVPAYHQLGLLFVKLNKTNDALKIFEEGIRIAALVGDLHAQSEMQESIAELG